MGRKERAKGWASYGINQWRKREIMAWCRQYDDWRSAISYGLSGIAQGSGGSGGNKISRPTEAQALRNERYYQNIEIVESAIRDVCPQIYDEMLDNIARGIPFSYLGVPYTERDFYAIRIAVYALISERKKT